MWTQALALFCWIECPDMPQKMKRQSYSYCVDTYKALLEVAKIYPSDCFMRKRILNKQLIPQIAGIMVLTQDLI
jgi:hypothetical protein